MTSRYWTPAVSARSMLHPGPTGLNYVASKAGLIALSQTLEKELAGKGITINVVVPGFIETDMLKSVPRETMEKILAQIPLGRLGKPSSLSNSAYTPFGRGCHSDIVE